MPRARDGSHRPPNLAFACQGCNGYKRADVDAIDPISRERVRLYHPRRDNWREHFAWNEDCTRLLGLTAIGRATIAKLALNRLGVVNLRRVLRGVGEHPPKETLPEE